MSLITTWQLPIQGDRILAGPPDCEDYRKLYEWAQRQEGLHPIVGDFHRLQLEYWLWWRITSNDFPRQRILDIGQPQWCRREWAITEGGVYATMGISADEAFVGTQDRVGDICQRASFGDEPWDIIVCTEVLEHCADPFGAVRNMHAALSPGGAMFASTPFLWPDHHCDDFPDYWRFTAQGWAQLLRPFQGQHAITGCYWSAGGSAAWELLRQTEGMGWRSPVKEFRATTGYLVEGRKVAAPATPTPDPTAATDERGQPLVHYTGCHTQPGHEACAARYAALHGGKG